MRWRLTLTACATLVTLGAGVAGCSGGSSGRGATATAAVSSQDGAAPSTSGVAPSQSQTPALPSADGPLDPALTLTIVAGGFSPGGAASGEVFGRDDVSPTMQRVAVLAGLPTSAENPSAPNQVTEVAYYGSVPPAYYSAEDVAEVEAAPRGAPRYALIVAKHVRHVLQRSRARHVNLAGASFGGVITRYLIERDLEGLASEGRIVRWLSIEGTAGGVWVASQVAGDPALMALAEAVIPDPADLPTMSYEFVRSAFGTDVANQSSSPFFAAIQTGFQVSTNHDYNQQALRVATNRPNDGVLLVEDQAVELLTRPQGAAVVLTDSTHDSARSHEGLAVDVVNFLRSPKRVRVRLVEVEVIDGGEPALLGRSEVAISATFTSPEAERAWGITTPVASVQRRFGVAPFAQFDDPQTLTFDATLYDWPVAPSEAALHLTLDAEQLDFSAYYDVLENPADEAQALAQLTTELPVDALGSYTVERETAALRVVLAVDVFEDRPR